MNDADDFMSGPIGNAVASMRQALNGGRLPSVDAQLGQPRTWFPCECDTTPDTMEGPQEHCPVHGNPQLFANWLNELTAENERLKSEVAWWRQLFPDTTRDVERLASKYKARGES
jgi:hypothetical protein